MVDFNTGEKIQTSGAPSYIGLSKPLSSYDIGIDKSASSAVSGFANTLETAVTGIDNTFKSIIDEAIRSGVDTERDNVTGAYEQIAGVPQANRVGSPPSPDNPYLQTSPASSSDSLTGTQSVPGPVQAGVDKVANLVNASTSVKGLSPSYYEGRLDTLARDLRAQYPGYKDYIDEKIAALTGGNPANKYMQELLTSINQSISNNKSDRDKAIEMLAKPENADNPAIPGLIAKIAAGKSANPLAEAAMVTQSWNAPMAAIKRREAERADMKGGVEEQRLQAEPTFSKLADTIVHSTTVAGIDGAQLTVDRLGQIIQDLQTGKASLTGPAREQLSQAVHALYDAAATSIDNQAGKQLYPGIPTLRQTLTSDVYNARKAQALDYLKTMVDAVDNEHYGLAGSIARTVKATNDETEYNLLYSRNADGTPNGAVRAATRFNKAITSMFGPNAITQFKQATINYSTPLANAVQTMEHNLMAGPKSDEPLTLQQALQRLDQNNIGKPRPDAPPGSPLADPNNPKIRNERKAYPDLIGAPNRAASNPNLPDEAKTNVFNQSFGSGNEAVLKYFAPDKLDNRGRLIGGQNAAFNAIVTPKVIDEAYRLGQKTDGTVWTNVKTWAETNHATLFASNVQDLSKLIDQNPNAQLKFIPGGNGADPHFELNITPKQRPAMGLSFDVSDQPFKQNAMLKVSELNQGLKAMSLIAKKDGTDVNQYVGKLIEAAGGADTNKVLGVIQQGLTNPEPQKKSDNGNTQKYGAIPPDNEGPLLSDYKSADNRVSVEDVTNKRSAGLNPKFRTNLENAINDYQDETGKSVKISSLVRTREEQAAAYQRYITGRAGLAAPPGHSRHEIGEAADLNTDPDFMHWLRANNRADSYGLEFLPGHAGVIDPAHIQLKRSSLARR